GYRIDVAISGEDDVSEAEVEVDVTTQNQHGGSIEFDNLHPMCEKAKIGGHEILTCEKSNFLPDSNQEINPFDAAYVCSEEAVIGQGEVVP
ncbi:hypothetical protein A2U01_0079803, partial [Trifolium medium]|nr:hypothetical protein [Trifolium medium]